MNTRLLPALFITLFSVSFRKDDIHPAGLLQRKWKLYSYKILKLDDSFQQGACGYQTQASDFYGPPTLASCQDDDTYDFTDQHSLTLYFGSKKCMVSEPQSIAKPYKQIGDSLFIEGTSYRIVLLSSDTLILDYCTEINPYPPGTMAGNRAKVGMKFIGTN